MIVIAIDGPAGSGKSTVARALAARLGIGYLDTGAMYRAVTVTAVDSGIDIDDHEAVGSLAARIDLSLGDDGVWADGVDVTEAIRTAETTAQVSHVAKNSLVRSEMVKRQRAWVIDHGGGVLEGRDIGTVVFPDATLKLYLTASPKVRAARRAAQMGAADHVQVEADLVRRDTTDSQRSLSPLTIADDATSIDTSARDVASIVDEIVGLLQ